MRKSKNQAKSPASSGQGVKRARGDEGEASSSKKTKISVKVNGVEIEIDQSSTASSKTAKAADLKKNVKLATTKAESKKTNQSTTKEKEKETSKKPVVSKASEKASSAKPTPAKPTKSTPTSKVTSSSQKTKPAGPSSSASAFKAHHPDNVFQAPPSAITKTAVKREPKAKPESSTSKVRASPIKKEPKIKSEQGLNRASPLKNEGYLFDANAMDTRPDMSSLQVSVTGVYHISCQQITEQLPDTANQLRLFICVDHETGTTWGGFELAMKSGVIKIDDIGVERKLSFGWRSRDSETGRLQFGKGCFGDIAFYGSGQVRGCFYNLFPMLGMSGVSTPAEFEGVRRPGPLWCGRSAPSFAEEWAGFVSEAYGR